MRFTGTGFFLALLAACAAPPAAPIVEPSDPTQVLIINAAVLGRTTNGGADSLLVPVRNLGRSGAGVVRAWGLHVHPDSADVLLGESAPFQLRYNQEVRATFNVTVPVPRSVSGNRYVAALSQDQGTGEFRHTSRRALQ